MIALVVALPMSAAALGLSHVIGFFNIFVGLMLATALVLYGTGFIMWLCRLGTWPSYRTEALRIMEWSVVVLFVLVVLLAIVQFFQGHPRTASYVVSTIVVLLVVGGALFAAAKSGEKKEEKKR